MTNLKTKILARVSEDLIAIEEALEQNLQPYLDLVSQTARHILFSGGKRLRPLLMVLSARLCGYQDGNKIRFSTLFEFLHAATLLHDDLVDGATVRRGKPVAHSIYGASVAVLVGDFLLARALTLAAETKKPRVIRVIAEITENMSQGEIEQLSLSGDLALSEEQYREIIRRKTAVLFQGACRVSAILADASDVKENALRDYGYHLGMAFQMADDLLDYTSDVESLGKQAGADLREGKLTLPVIYALKKASTRDRLWMEKIISSRQFNKQEFLEMVAMLVRYDAIAYTRLQAKAHVEAAKTALSVFEPSGHRAVMEDIADYALLRQA